MAKVWKYCYVDSIEVSYVQMPDFPEPSKSITATHQNFPTPCYAHYVEEDNVVFIFTDEEIPELELVTTDLEAW